MQPDRESRVWHLTQLNKSILLHAKYTAHRFSPHYHDEVAIGIIESGQLNVQIGGQSERPVRKGDIIFINPGQIHHGFADRQQGCVYRMFYLPMSLVSRAIKQGEDVIPEFTRNVVQNTSLASQLIRVHADLTKLHIALPDCQTQLFAVINQLVDLYASNDRVKSANATPSAATILRAKAYLETHLHEKVSLEILSKEANLSPYHLLRTFKATFGMTPHAFQIQLRIDRAKSLLVDGGAISHVAYDLGFYDQSHFTKQFKSLVGVTPQQYRRNSNFFL